ncbi:MAG TPA: SRPBCC family protein [Solirubrobacteraceae bacterium]|nr:SRPBCC family protein [Solirubrobacteraceae bacterium]
MAVDVVTEVVIARPRVEVAEFVADPDNATAWCMLVKAVDWRRPRGATVAVGSRVGFVASFLGRRFAYTCEVVEHVQGERLRMRSTDAAFPMETTYAWRDLEEGITAMRLRNRAEPAGAVTYVAPALERAIRYVDGRDMGRLKRMLEMQSRPRALTLPSRLRST